MQERTTQAVVTFLHPFSLLGIDAEQPAGTYIIETIEEPIGGLSSIAYRRVSTSILLPSPVFGQASRQAVTIDPGELDAALKADAEPTK